MESVKFQVLGYKNIQRKSDQKDMTIITCISTCTPADNSRGAFGNKYTDFFLPDEKVGSLTLDCIGKEFIPAYEINGFGKPSLCDYSFKDWK